jgi:ArsR family transcriptional regulator
MNEVVDIAKALGDETRVRAVLALRGGERCVCQLVRLLGLADSTVSKHMAILKAAGLVESRKSGRWVYYRLPGDGASDVVRDALGWLMAHAAKSERARADAASLRAILRISPEELCAGRPCRGR